MSSVRAAEATHARGEAHVRHHLSAFLFCRSFPLWSTYNSFLFYFRFIVPTTSVTSVICIVDERRTDEIFLRCHFNGCGGHMWIVYYIIIDYISSSMYFALPGALIFNVQFDRKTENFCLDLSMKSILYQ